MDHLLIHAIWGSILIQPQIASSAIEIITIVAREVQYHYLGGGDSKPNYSNKYSILLPTVDVSKREKVRAWEMCVCASQSELVLNSDRQKHAELSVYLIFCITSRSNFLKVLWGLFRRICDLAMLQKRDGD